MKSRGTNYHTGLPNNPNLITEVDWRARSCQLSGRVPFHITNLNSALKDAIPPKKGKPGYRRYKRQIADLISTLILHLSDLD